MTHDKPVPEGPSSEKIEVTREDLHPKIRVQRNLAGVLAAVAIVLGAVKPISEALNFPLPAVVGSVVSMGLLLLRGYAKAGDGR